MNYKLSIILPCYNIAEYVEKCITSILPPPAIQLPDNQQFEIIIIDDGSKDNLLEKCEQWRDDNRIKVFHYENKGVSSARNTGILHATGDYIWFIDPDDFITSDALQKIFQQLTDNPDILLFGFNILSEINHTSTTTNSFLLKDCHEVRILNNNSLLKEFIPFIIGYSQENINRMYEGKRIPTKDGFMFGAVWHYVFKRDIIIKNNIKFITELRLNEDTIFTLEYLCYANRMKVLPYNLYNYTLRESGAMHRILINPEILFQTKMQLAIERNRINSIYLKKHHVDLSNYYAGSLLLSALELGVKLSNRWNNIGMFKQYAQNLIVRKAIDEINVQNAPLKYKIPITLLKKEYYHTLYAMFFFLHKIGYKTKIH